MLNRYLYKIVFILPILLLSCSPFTGNSFNNQGGGGGNPPPPPPGGGSNIIRNPLDITYIGIAANVQSLEIHYALVSPNDLVDFLIDFADTAALAPVDLLLNRLIPEQSGLGNISVSGFQSFRLTFNSGELQLNGTLGLLRRNALRTTIVPPSVESATFAVDSSNWLITDTDVLTFSLNNIGANFHVIWFLVTRYNDGRASRTILNRHVQNKFLITLNI